MKSKAIIRLFAIVLAASSCVMLISYKQTKASAAQECSNGEKCEQKNTQTDLILLESISKHLLSSTDN